MAQAGRYAKATFDFIGESSTDLSFSVGDVVKITGVVDDNWVTGSLAGSSSTGSFPKSFVEPLTLPSVLTGQKLYLALQDFPADQIGDLELTKGNFFFSQYIIIVYCKLKFQFILFLFIIIIIMKIIYITLNSTKL